MKNKKSKLTYSQILPIITGLLFILTLTEIVILKLLGVDINDFSTQQIITTGGLFGVNIVAYSNKEKMFNVSRLKMDTIKWTWEFKESHKLDPTQFEEIQSQVQSIDDAVDSKIDSAISDAINEDVQIPSI